MTNYGTHEMDVSYPCITVGEEYERLAEMVDRQAAIMRDEWDWSERDALVAAVDNAVDSTHLTTTLGYFYTRDELLARLGFRGSAFIPATYYVVD